MDTDLADPDGFGAPGRHPLPEPAAFATRLGALGIGSDDTIVAYDDVGGGYAARLWWMLDDLGHRDVHLLDGGIGAWTAAGLPLTTDVPSWPSATLVLADRWSRVIDRDTLVDRLGTVVLLDARAPERYRGEVEPIDPVAGHIPTALNAPTGGNLAPDGRFLAAEALAARFASAGDRWPGAWRAWIVGVGRGDVVRQRHHRLPERPRHSCRGAAGAARLCRLVQRLEPIRDAGRDRPRPR